MVQDGGSSGSEEDSIDDDNSGDDPSKAKKNINPGHVREIDAAAKVCI